MTREEAITILADHDANKWGEQYRSSSREHYERTLSHGLAVNRVATLDPDNINEDLAKEAEGLFTLADWRHLGEGG